METYHTILSALDIFIINRALAQLKNDLESIQDEKKTIIHKRATKKVSIIFNSFEEKINRIDLSKILKSKTYTN